MSNVRHAMAFDPNGGRWASPRYMLCGGEAGEGVNVSVTDERVTCARCLRRFRLIPLDRDGRRAWMAKNGIVS